MKTSQSIFLIWTNLILLLALLNPFTIWAQDFEQMLVTEKHFNGFYVGTSIGSQNIYGGAFIDDLDVFAQKSSAVIDFSAGYRMQLAQNKIMVGGEIFYGIVDGDLTTIDTRSQTKIFYANDYQIGLGLQAGVVLGKENNVLLYVFYNETKRVFDIHFTPDNGIKYTQKDTEYITRCGIGVEIPVYKQLNMRVNIANTYANFDDVKTSMKVNNKLDYNIGFLLNF